MTAANDDRFAGKNSAAPIHTDDDVLAALTALRQLDPRLGIVHDTVGKVPLRRGRGGIRGLAAIIIAQQVSKASADAILDRLQDEIDLDDAAAILAADDAAFRRAGVSRPKQRSLRALAEAMTGGSLCLERVGRSSPEAAIAELVAINGIGAWTAECYLLFCIGHPDVFPSGDLALQVGVGHALGHCERPKARMVAEIARQWAPHRSVAARLFWAYYAAITHRNAEPIGWN